MTASEFDDPTLMAFADGALEPEAARRVAEAARDDPAMAGRIEMFRKTGALLGDLAASRREEPLPESLVAGVDAAFARHRQRAAPGGKVAAFAPARAPAWRPAALAASIALVVGIGGGILATLSVPRAEAPASEGFALLDAPEIAVALGTLASGERDPVAGGEIVIVSSFLADGNVFCREFEIAVAAGETIVSVACREEGRWTPRFAVLTGSAAGAAYAPASALEPLDAFLSSIGAGRPLPAGQEADRLAAAD